MYLKHRPEIQTQFEIGKYLASIDDKYEHPLYRVDFLLRFSVNDVTRDIIIEYDGFEFHFENRSEIDAGNWKHFLKESDIEREHILESYGYKTIRLNKFNVGDNPADTISDAVEELLKEFDVGGDALIKQVVEDTAAAHEGLISGTYKVCRKCDQNKPKEEFANPNTSTGYGRFCQDCQGPIKKKKRKERLKIRQGHKKCPT